MTQSIVVLAMTHVSYAEPPGALSKEAAAAFDTIRKAEFFCSQAVGEGGDTPEVVLAFRILIKSPVNDEAFKQLLREATLPGQLYALCGIYYTDEKDFPRWIEQYRGKLDKVPTFIGCIQFEQTVASIVESDAANVVRLQGREQSIHQWIDANNANGMAYDIIGGGWPNIFKESGGFRARPPADVQRKDKGKGNRPNKAMNRSRRARGS